MSRTQFLSCAALFALATAACLEAGNDARRIAGLAAPSVPGPADVSTLPWTWSPSASRRVIKGAIDSILNLQASSGRLTSAVGFRSCGAFDFAMTYSAYSAIIAIQYYRYTGDAACLRSLLPRLEAATAFHATRLDASGLVVTNDPDYWQTTQSGEVTEYSLAYDELLQNMI